MQIDDLFSKAAAKGLVAVLYSFVPSRFMTVFQPASDACSVFAASRSELILNKLGSSVSSKFFPSTTIEAIASAARNV
jgi:hypothetical protein